VAVVNRMAYIVYFQDKKFVSRLKDLPVNISYISKKSEYAIFYGEKTLKKAYLNKLKTFNGFIDLEDSLLFNEEYNFMVD